MHANSLPRRRAFALVAAVALLAGPLGARPVAAQAACPDPVPESEWSEIVPLATESMMIDVTPVGSSMYAVGDRGQVLFSADQGQSWKQQVTPTRSMLTAVWFADESHGWAVGHDAVILRTENGGETWCRAHWAPELEKPLFDVWFADRSHGFAIGAYGYFLHTEDGGLTWTEEMLNLVEAEEEMPAGTEEGGDAGDDWGMDDWDEDFNEGGDFHLNKIVLTGTDRMYIAAEAGSIYRSDDGGESWLQLDSPYDGSFFSGIHLQGDSLLIFGLRGNMFRTDDAGETWRRIDLPVDTSLFGGTRLEDGTVLVVGGSGVVLVSREGDSFRLVQRPDRKVIVTVQPAGDDGIVAVGEPGVERIERSELAAK